MIMLFFLILWCLHAINTLESNLDILRAELTQTRAITAKMGIDVIKMRRCNVIHS